MAGPGGAEVGRVSVRVVPNTDGFRQRLKRELRNLDKAVKARIAVDVDAKAAKAKMAELSRQLQSNNVSVGVNVDEGGAKTQLRRLLQELRAEAKLARIDVDVAVDNNRLQRGAAALESMAGSAGMASRTFLGLSRTGWIVAAVFAAIAPAVGLVSGLLAGIPSLVGAFGAGIGAVALGLDGIKAAAAPLAPLLATLKSEVSGVFAQRLPPIFEQLATHLLPTITTGMKAVAGGMTDMFGGFAQGMIGPAGEGITHLNTILQGTAQLMTGLAPTVERFTATFLQAGAAGANAFGYLQTMLANFANGFGDTIDRMIASGSFDGALQGLSVALGGFLDLFNRLFEVGAQAMSQLGQPLNNLFGGFGDLLVSAMPALTSFSAGVANTIGALGTSLAPAFAALTPALDAIMPTITQLATVLGETLSSAVIAIAPVLTQLAQALGPVLTSAVTALAPIMTQLATTLGGVLLEAVTALAPLMPMLTATFQQLASALGEGLATLLPVVAQAFVQLLPVVVQLVPPLLQIVQAFIPLIPAAAEVAAALLELVSAATPLLAVFGQLVAFVAQVVAKIVEMGVAIVTQGIEPFRNFATAVTESFAQFVSTIAEGISQAIGYLAALPGQLKAAVGDLSGLLVSAGADLIRGLINGIKSMVGAAVNAAKNVASSVVGAVKGFLGINSPSKVFHDIGEGVGEGFINGIDAQTRAAADKAADMAAQAVAAANTAMQGATGTVDMSALDDELKHAKELLDLKTKMLAVEKDRTEDAAMRAAITAQQDQLNARKREIALQREQLGYQKQYGAEVATTANDYNSLIEQAARMPANFAQAGADQFMSDLGISGNGALSQLARAGIDYGSQFVFNVSGIGDALSAQSVLQNKQALAATGR